MSSNNRIVSVVDDDVRPATFFPEALRPNLDGISIFSFIDPVKAFEHFSGIVPCRFKNVRNLSRR